MKIVSSTDPVTTTTAATTPSDNHHEQSAPQHQHQQQQQQWLLNNLIQLQQRAQYESLIREIILQQQHQQLIEAARAAAASVVVTKPVATTEQPLQISTTTTTTSSAAAHENEMDEPDEEPDVEMARVSVEYTANAATTPTTPYKFYRTRIGFGRKQSAADTTASLTAAAAAKQDNVQIKNSTFVSRHHFVMQLVIFLFKDIFFDFILRGFNKF